MSTEQVLLSPVPLGKTIRIASENQSVAVSKSYTFNTDAEAVLVSLYVTSVGANLDLSVYTQTEAGKDLLVATFPTVTAPTANLLIKKAATIISQVRVEVVTTGAAQFEVYARGVNAAEASVKVLGATTARVSQFTLPAVTTLLIPAALTDRTGLIVKNNNGTGGAAFYFGFTSGEATVATGYPISAQESIGMDIASGVEVYAISATGTTDCRIIEAGS